jgi:trimethylamine--corrinoid protein Co-methyltransferase
MADKKPAVRKRRRRRGKTSAIEVRKAPAYIKRAMPTLDAMDEAGLVRIEEVADILLRQHGLAIHGDEVATDLFRKAGATAHGEKLRFEPGMLQEILQTAPRSFTQHGRGPDRAASMGNNDVVFAPAYGSPFVMDLDEGRRYGTLADFENFVRLAYSSPWLHHSGGTVCEPVDVPVNKRHLDMVYAHLRYSDKPFLGSVTSAERAADSIEMCRIVFGADFVDQNCVIMGNVNVNSPLMWDTTMTSVIRTYAAAGQGSVIVPFILAGAMGPVTTAGAIAQAHAETLVGCALTQLVRPGAPVVYGNFLSSMDLRSGSPAFGTPEPAAGSMVVGQLARRLGLPLRCAGSFTNSKLPDAQAMQESTVSMLSAIHCGANFILHSAGFLDGLLSMSYEKFVLDADFCGSLHTYMQGVNVDDDSFALDAYDEVEPAGHFFGCAHTMRHYKTAFWESDIADRRPHETWSEDGEMNSMAVANKRWKNVLKEYQAPDLDIAIDDALRAFVEKRKTSMADMWY